MKTRGTKKPICTTVDEKDGEVFYAICFHEHGPGKYSIQKGLTEAIMDYNRKKLLEMEEEERKSVFEVAKKELKESMLMRERAKKQLKTKQ